MVETKRPYWGLFFLLLASWGVGPQATETDERITAPDNAWFAFRLNTPTPTLSDDGDGYYSIEIEGFETHQRRLGAPALPAKTVLVAIPPGAVPRLEFPEFKFEDNGSVLFRGQELLAPEMVLA